MKVLGAFSIKILKFLIFTSLTLESLFLNVYDTGITEHSCRFIQITSIKVKSPIDLNLRNFPSSNQLIEIFLEDGKFIEIRLIGDFEN